MNEISWGLWPLVVFLTLWACGALMGKSVLRMAFLLGLVGAGLSLYYYSLGSSFWPLIYFLIYMIVFAAWLMMALTFPQVALRDDALEGKGITASPFMALQSKWPWRKILKYLLMALLAVSLAGASLTFAQTLAALPAINLTNLTAADYFIDLAALSIFLLGNVVGLVFVFQAGAD